MSIIFNEVKKAMLELGKCRKHGVLGGFAWQLRPAEEEEEEEGRKIFYLVQHLPRVDQTQSWGFSHSQL